MFERFTPDAKQLFLEAEAQRLALEDETVGSGHLLLALSVDEGPGGEVLRRQGLHADLIKARLRDSSVPASTSTEEDDQLLQSLGIDVAKIRESLEETFGPGALDKARAHGARNRWGRRSGKQVSGFAGSNGRARWDANAKQVLEQSLRDTLRLGTKHIGPEHIGLGLIVERDGLVSHLLGDEGIDLVELQASWEAVARGTAIR